MDRLLVLVSAAVLVLAIDGTKPDQVTNLPQYGPVKGVQYAGLIPINSTYDKHLFYWFVEASSGNVPGKTPLLIWMNGGPGSSSLTGLLAENIGPISLHMEGKTNFTLQDNPNTWAKRYHIIAIDNPVGAGFSFTKEGGYVKSEIEMRREYYAGLMGFFALHPEYRTNPVWVTGESYGGKYVPNVAFEIYQRAELNLQGVIIGNGMFKPELQYPTIPEYAFNEGILDRHGYRLAKEKIDECVLMIQQGKYAEAKVFCEASVDWIYGSNQTGAGQFLYDLGMTDGIFMDDLTAAMGTWLNSKATREALHVGEHTWVQADERGPVADALVADFVTDQSLLVLEDLLAANKYRIVTYNGVRDGSLCNHVGHGKAMDAIPWEGRLRFQEAFNKPFLVKGAVAGYRRSYGKLEYFTLLRTGHLVPIVVPGVAMAMIDSIVEPDEPKIEHVVV